MSDLEFLARLAVGLGCGVLIGLERQWRQRMAGLRTNALVATGACLFVLLQAATLSGSDRIAAQIVTGVGFLGAGVILRDGLSIRGINTAATLWCAAAVGALAGSGLFLFALIGSGAAVLANIGLRPLARTIDNQPRGAVEVETNYEFVAVTRAKQEATVRALIVQALSGESFELRAVSSERIDESTVEVRAMLTTHGAPDHSQLENAVSRLSLQPSISAVSWEVKSPDAEGDEDAEPPLRRWPILRRARAERVSDTP